MSRSTQGLDEFDDVSDALLNEYVVEAKATRLQGGEDYFTSSSTCESALLGKQLSWKRTYSMALLFAEVGEREYIGNGRKEHGVVG